MQNMTGLAGQIELLSKQLAEIEAEANEAEQKITGAQKCLDDARVTLEAAKADAQDVLDQRDALLAQIAKLAEQGQQVPGVSSYEILDSADGSTHLILLKPVSELSLPVRARNFCKHGNIRYIGDLVQLTKEEVHRGPNIGYRTLDAIEMALTRHGLKLGMVISNWPPPGL